MSMEVRLEQIERELKELKRREDKKNDSELSITSVRKPGEIVTSSFISKEIKTFDFETGKQEVVIEGPYFDESGKILREARLARCSQCKKLFSADSVISFRESEASPASTMEIAAQPTSSPADFPSSSLPGT